MQTQIETMKKSYNRKRGGHLRLETDQVGNSPRIALAVDSTLYGALVKRADQEKTTVSALTREALRKLLSDH